MNLFRKRVIADVTSKDEAILEKGVPLTQHDYCPCDKRRETHRADAT